MTIDEYLASVCARTKKEYRVTIKYLEGWQQTIETLPQLTFAKFLANLNLAHNTQVKHIQTARTLCKKCNLDYNIGTIKKAGKNHVRVNGTLLQTNKKWSQLKQKQREWIYEITRKGHGKFLDENNMLPMKTGKKKLIADIVNKIDERGIWLPSYELERGIGKYIDRLNRKTPLDRE